MLLPSGATSSAHAHGLDCRTIRRGKAHTVHVHVGLLHALIFLAYLLIVGAGIRIVSARFSDTPVGKALAFIY